MDYLEKRALERALRESGWSRTQAKAAVARIATAMAKGQLKVAKGSTLPDALQWLRGRAR